MTEPKQGAVVLDAIDDALAAADYLLVTAESRAHGHGSLVRLAVGVAGELIPVELAILGHGVEHTVATGDQVDDVGHEADRIGFQQTLIVGTGEALHRAQRADAVGEEGFTGHMAEIAARK